MLLCESLMKKHGRLDPNAQPGDQTTLCTAAYVTEHLMYEALICSFLALQCIFIHYSALKPHKFVFFSFFYGESLIIDAC